MKSKTLMLLGLCLVMWCCMPGSAAAAVFHYQDLSLQGLPKDYFPQAINDNCWIVGDRSYISSGLLVQEAFVWRPGIGLSILKTLGGGSAQALGLNNLNQIVGRSQDASGTSKPCLWTDPSKAPIEMWSLGTPGTGHGINNTGQAAGQLAWGTAAKPVEGCRWDPPVQQTPLWFLKSLGGKTSSGRGINDSGSVVGSSATAEEQTHACLWTSWDLPQDLLPSLTESRAIAINNPGNVVGIGAFTGLGMGHAFYWDHLTGVTLELCPEDYESLPWGITDANHVLGYRMAAMNHSPVFYWSPGGGLQDLENLVADLPVGVTLAGPLYGAISPKGYITGVDSQGHTYLLTPLPWSQSPLMLLLD